MITRRDIEVSAPTATSGSRSRKVVATIGIDRYQHWQRLANAVRDATETAELFRRLGFEQITAPLLDHDATGQAIQALVTVGLKKLLGPDDSLVLFYAGHGATYGHRPAGEEIKTGYLIPTDASVSPDDASTWIDLEGWLRAVALLPARHILVILDACRSGIALDGVIQRHRGDDAWQHETSATLQARRSRRIITSALGDQVALDSGPKHGHSLFTGCLIEGLTYDLQRRGEHVTTGSGLGMYLQRRVDSYTQSQQTPDLDVFSTTTVVRSRSSSARTPRRCARPRSLCHHRSSPRLSILNPLITTHPSWQYRSPQIPPLRTIWTLQQVPRIRHRSHRRRNQRLDPRRCSGRIRTRPAMRPPEHGVAAGRPDSYRSMMRSYPSSSSDSRVW